MRRRPGTGTQAGFTVLELLVAIAIFAVLGAMSYGGLQALLEVRSAAEREMDRLAALQKGLALLQQDIEQAIARPIRDVQGDRQPALVGRAGGSPDFELTRAGWLDPAQPDGERLRRVGYRLEGGRLLRSAWAVLDRAPDSAPSQAPVLEAVAELGVRYLTPTGEWAPVWPAAGSASGSLPLAIEVTVTTERWGRIRRVFRVPQG